VREGIIIMSNTGMVVVGLILLAIFALGAVMWNSNSNAIYSSVEGIVIANP